MKSRNCFIILSVIFLLLLIPFAAMQFTDEVNWTITDFLIAAGLLLVTGFIFDFILKKAKSRKQKTIFSLILLVIFLLIWAELAVGIF